MQLLENRPIIKEKHIRGIALVPRISRNENLYTKKELARAHGVKVPLNWEHSDRVIGQVMFTYDEEYNQVRYEGELFDFALPMVEGREVYASIEAKSDSNRTVCNEADDCFNMPQGLRFEALALTLTPGIPETSAIVESTTNPEALENPYINPTISESCMTADTKVEMMDPEAPQGEEQPAITTPTDTKVYDDKTVPADNTERKEADAPNMDGGDDDDRMEKEMDDDKIDERIASIAARATAEALAKFKAESKTDVAEMLKGFHSTPIFGAPEFNRRGLFERLLNTGRAAWKVPIAGYERIIDTTPAATPKLTEAIAFTPANSNSSQIVTTDRIFVQPSGKFAQSIRHLVRYREIPEGVDQIKELRTGVVSQGAINEGSSTTESTSTITGVTLSADNVRGVANGIKKTDVEDTQGDIIGSLTEQARIEALDYEAGLVFDTAADAVSASNIGAWIDGDGDTTTDDDVSTTGTFDHEALLVARQHFEEQGYPTAPGDLKCALHPKALRELRANSDIQRYVQEGNAMVTQSGQLAQLYGIDLLPTIKVNQTGGSTQDAYRNIVFSPPSAFLLASKRDVEINILYQPNKFSYDWSWSHRKNATVFDPQAIVRISSAA